jgi:hypothetical protein
MEGCDYDCTADYSSSFVGADNKISASLSFAAAATGTGSSSESSDQLTA